MVALDYSVRGGDRFTKIYHPRYRYQGKWIVVDKETYSTRTMANQRGLELQADADASMNQESNRVKEMLAKAENS